MSAACWNITGLSMSVVGILTLFVFQMPFRVRRGGAIYRELQQRDESAIRKERWFGVFGWIGLALVVAGALCQMVANLTIS